MRNAAAGTWTLGERLEGKLHGAELERLGRHKIVPSMEYVRCAAATSK